MPGIDPSDYAVTTTNTDTSDPLGDFINSLNTADSNTLDTDLPPYDNQPPEVPSFDIPEVSPDWFSNIFGASGSKIWDSLKSILPGGSGGPSPGGGLVGALALAKLLGNGGDRPLAGYQGGIPAYTAARDQYPRPTTATGGDDGSLYRQYEQGIAAGRLPEQLRAAGTAAGLPDYRMDEIIANKGGGRRAGSGGVRYFSPMTYTPTPAAGAPTTPATPGTPGTPGTPATPDTGGPRIPLDSNGQPIQDGGPLDPTGGAASGGLIQRGLGSLPPSRFLQGPGDGTSDSIQAKMAGGGQARLADGEFVIDARTVSELGNGSSAAGAEELYKMIERVQQMRKRAQRGKPSGASRVLPA